MSASNPSDASDAYDDDAPFEGPSPDAGPVDDLDDDAPTTNPLVELAEEQLRPPPPPRKRPPTIEILHDAQGFQAIQKPAGLTSIQERWDPHLATVIDELWKIWQRDDPDAPRPHVVHRLDKDTSGLLLFAKNGPTQAELRKQFRERTVEKTYWAIVAGIPAESSGRIEIEVQPARRPGRMAIVARGGKECRTDYRVLETFGDLALVELSPHQGRTHQIRLCLKAIGHPCAIDPFYGSRDPILLSRYKRRYSSPKGRPERPLIDRLTLHALRLVLRDPLTGAPLTLEAPPPKDFAATLKQLRRWA